MNPSTPTNTDATQADALARLVELEARWVNVPLAVATDSAAASLAGLVAKQKAFDAYRAQLVSYNQRYRPVYDGQRPVNTAVRLAAWCRTMADLYRRAGRAECPVNLLEQAHRGADRLGTRLNRDLIARPAAVTSTADAIAGLGAVANWCDGLVPATGPLPTTAAAPQVQVCGG
jgi:hypothetical protein